jgi:hypothetical protein
MKQLIEARREMLRTSPYFSLRAPTMAEQCGMDPKEAVAWQAAMILEGNRKVLTYRQTKLDKSKAAETGYVNLGLTMASANEATPFISPKYNACPGATKACIDVCVGSRTGQGRLPSSSIARIGRSLVSFFYKTPFNMLFDEELRKATLSAEKKGLKVAFRYNIATDWWKDADDAASHHQTVKFYDYTAVMGAVRRKSLVSRVYSHKDGRMALTMQALSEGRGVAIVFNLKARTMEPLPKAWNGYPVIDGDVNDLWFTRAPESGPFIVGLRVKGSDAQIAKAVESKFAVEPLTCTP